MRLPLVVNPLAEDDLRAAKVWYDERRPGLGDEFLLCVEDVFDRVQRARILGTVFQDLRLALVRRFPYAVVYRIDEDQITVVAVYHTRRDPRVSAGPLVIGNTGECLGPTMKKIASKARSRAAYRGDAKRTFKKKPFGRMTTAELARRRPNSIRNSLAIPSVNPRRPSEPS